MLEHVTTQRLLTLMLTVYVAGCTASEPEVCKNLPGTPEEIAATPRADENIELLALSLTQHVTADQSIYDRLVRDIKAIKEMEPRVRDIKYEEPYDGTQLSIGLDERTIARLKAGRYDDWQCLNRHFKSASISQSETGATIKFHGRYNLVRLGELYAMLPSVKYADPISFVSLGENSTIRVTRESQTWHYVFSTQINPGPQTLFYFTSDGVHMPVLVASTHSLGMAMAPQWMKKYWYGPEALRAFGYDIE